MKSTDPSADIQKWGRVLHRELVAYLGELTSDAAVCGFAFELPADFSNDGIMPRIAKCPEGSRSKDEFPGWDDWEYRPDAEFGASNDGLQAMYVKYSEPLGDEEFYDDFGDQLYAACLSAMQKCVAAGEFGEIRVRLLTFSDDEHPIIDEAIEVLNDEESQEIAREVLGR